MLALLSALSAIVLASAPPVAWLQERVPEHELITLSDGLADSTVFSIDQDGLGRMWFGTASGGANVFDGHRLRAFVNEPRPDSLSQLSRMRSGVTSLTRKSRTDSWNSNWSSVKVKSMAYFLGMPSMRSAIMFLCTSLVPA